MARSFPPWMPAAMMVVSALMMTLEAVFLRLMAGDTTQGQVLLFRSGLQLLMICAYGAAVAGGMGVLVRTRRLRKHLLRGALAAVSWWCYFMSFKTLPLALATTLTFSSQLFMLLLVWPMLRERVTRPQMVTTVFGFFGILLAAGAWDPGALDWHVGYGLAAAMLGAVMIVITRSLSFTERTDTILFYMALIVFLSAIPQCIFDWKPLTTHSLVLLVLMALTGTLGAWASVEAYRLAAPSGLAPYTYSRLIFAAVLGYWLFADVIAGTTVMGALLIVASNLALLVFAARANKVAASGQ